RRHERRRHPRRLRVHRPDGVRRRPEAPAVVILEAAPAAPTIELVDSIRAVPEGEWDALAAGRTFYASHAWLRAVERDPAFEARYVLARSRGRLVGVLPTYLWDGAPGWVTGYYDPFGVVAARFADEDERARWFPT